MLALFTQYFFMSKIDNFCYNYNELIVNDKKILLSYYQCDEIIKMQHVIKFMFIVAKVSYACQLTCALQPNCLIISLTWVLNVIFICWIFFCHFEFFEKENKC
jgi:hypothetical protein